ncbi:unnamed protein product [Parnassius apollo]|uniref:(apollo) hypothetical protein n=1 Tax=Parnassius apollo TaxID=110799 RepID=A0A8S3Y8D5_PARAO|nr:unnamed protein product [Parnassius apollo]
MQPTARIALSMCVLISAIEIATSSSTKLRRDGVLNLYPFPRVGRAHHTWQVPLNDEYFESELASKRQLYAFPRVGRSDSEHRSEPYQHLNRLNVRLQEMMFGQPRSHENMKRESESTSGGMWFGPRIGRAYNYDDISSHRETSGQSDPEETENDLTARKKRQVMQD